jgi:hypothetical protein
MIRVLVRHDPDLKLLRWLLPGAVAVGAWMGWVFRHWSSTLAHYENSGMTPPSAPLGMMLLGALSLGLYGILLATNSRKVSALGMVLPVTGRQLVLARAITLTIAFAAPVLLYTLVAATVVFDAEWSSRFVLSAYFMVLGYIGATGIAFRVNVRVDRSPNAALLWLLIFVPLGCVMGMIAGWPELLGPAVLALGIWVYVAERVPAGLRLAEPARVEDVLRPPLRHPLRPLLVKQFLLRRSAWLGMLFLAGMLVLFTGTHGRIQRTAFVLLPVFWILFPFANNLRQASAFGTLPLPRRRLFRWIVLPPLAAIAFGAALAVPLRSALPLTSSLEQGVVRLGYLRYDGDLRQEPMLPPAYWRRADVHVEPGAETPPTRSLFGEPSPYFNPYRLPADASEADGIEQLQRAVRNVHGVFLSDREAAAVWRREVPLGEVTHLSPPWNRRLAPARTLLAAAQWSLLAMLALTLATINPRPAATPRARRRRILGSCFLLTLLVGGSIGIALGVDALFGSEADWAAFLVEDWLTRRPLALAAAALALVAAWWACWRWNLSRFERMELASPPPRTPF